MENTSAEKAWKSIDECVENALESGSHDAMAKLMAENRLWNAMLFSDNLERFMKEKSLEAGQGICETVDARAAIINGFGILSPTQWYSYGYDTETEQKGYTYAAIKKWVNGESLPPRECILQIGLFMKASVEEANVLLRAAGYHGLYDADISDVIFSYYFIKNGTGQSRCKGQTSGETHVQKEHGEKQPWLSVEAFMEIKRKYNKILRLFDSKPDYGTKECKMEEAAIPLFLENKTQEQKGRKSIYREDNGEGYYEFHGGKLFYHPFKGTKPVMNDKSHHIVSKIKSQILSEADGFFPGTDIFVTDYIRRHLLQNMESEEELFSFLEKNTKFFQGVHYRLLQSMESYLETPEYYKKNIYQYAGTFTPEDEGYLLMPENIIDEMIIGAGECIKKGSTTDKKKVITTILSMEYKHIMFDAYEKVLELKGIGSFSVLPQFFDGRKETDAPDGEKRYQYEHPPKSSLIRMLSAMGREDEMGTMMMQAGYWDRDWIIEKEPEQCPYLDALDWLMIYMLRFRNRLLEVWAKSLKEIMPYYKNRSIRIFPFHQMMLCICHEIQGFLNNPAKCYQYYQWKQVKFPVPNAKKKRC